jgi:UDP-glucose 4-epimerase
MAKVLVTGGSGFLGSHIADALTNIGHDVLVFDKEISPWLRPEQRFVQGDINDEAALAVLLADVDYVYHLAALADLNRAKELPTETVAINILGTVNLLKQCVKNKIKRFVFGSTVYVYSREGGFYRCSKQACENYIEEFNKKYQLDYTILRYGSLYGKRSAMTNGVYKLLHQFMNSDELSFPGSIDEKREYIHVEDAARLSAKIMENDEFKNRHLIISGNDHLRIDELFSMFSEILNRNVNINYDGSLAGRTAHYKLTPYAYTPKLGHKLISNDYVDMGQGIIQLIEEIHMEQLNENEKNV